MLTNAHTLMLRDLSEIHEDITKKEKVLSEQNVELEVKNLLHSPLQSNLLESPCEIS